MTTLPDKPSELIRLALDDLAKVERSKRYVVNMNGWHEPNGRCAVCLAGAVMAQHFGASPKQNMFPSDYHEETCGKLQALDHFRLGWADDGIDCMDLEPNDSVTNRDIPGYSDDRPGFKRALRKLAKDLEKEGL